MLLGRSVSDANAHRKRKRKQRRAAIRAAAAAYVKVPLCAERESASFVSATEGNHYRTLITIK